MSESEKVAQKTTTKHKLYPANKQISKNIK